MIGNVGWHQFNPAGSCVCTCAYPCACVVCSEGLLKNTTTTFPAGRKRQLKETDRGVQETLLLYSLLYKVVAQRGRRESPSYYENSVVIFLQLIAWLIMKIKTILQIAGPAGTPQKVQVAMPGGALAAVTAIQVSVDIRVIRL